LDYPPAGLAVVSLVDQRLSYPLRLDLATCEISGNTVLAGAVPACPQTHKPVYYRNKGLVGGVSSRWTMAVVRG
jgi:hypothetical protein